MTNVTDPSEETFKIENSICTKRKIGKVPPTHNIRFIKPKTKRRKRNV